jgi:hypothetical protein
LVVKCSMSPPYQAPSPPLKRVAPDTWSRVGVERAAGSGTGSQVTLPPSGLAAAATSSVPPDRSPAVAWRNR